MQSQKIDTTKEIFQSRLKTLTHLLKAGEEHFGEGVPFLQKRIVADMHPLGTQVAFTCNQPRNFALWCQGEPRTNLDPEVTTLEQAHRYIAQTAELVSGVQVGDEKLSELLREDLSGGLYIEATGHRFVDDFLLPNFYFHLVTAYDILRMEGVPIGKRDYMIHAAPLVKMA